MASLCGGDHCGKSDGNRKERGKRKCGNAAKEIAAGKFDKRTDQKERNYKKTAEIPSPTKRKYSPGSARNPGAESLWKNVYLRRSIEKRSPFTRLRCGVCAGMTVEAAMVLPLCLFFLLNLGSAIEMIRLHNNLQLALWDTGGRLALYGCEQSDSAPASLLSAFYVRNRVTDYLGEDYLDGSPLNRGSGGLRLWESGMLKGDMLDIRLTYAVETPFSLGGRCSFRMENRYCVHLWNGYELPGETEKNAETAVYVTENGAVCHRDRNCTHLRLTVREVAEGSIAGRRNQWGRKYEACEKCARGQAPGSLYITSEGSCYHYRTDCPGLKRTVYTLTLEEAAGYPFCSRCGQR